jgi:hypothetical protein
MSTHLYRRESRVGCVEEIFVSDIIDCANWLGRSFSIKLSLSLPSQELKFSYGNDFEMNRRGYKKNDKY